MRETSLEAFQGIKKELPEKRSRVLSAINETGDHGATLFELVEILGRPINEISGRVTELSKGEMIEDSGRRMNPETGKASTIWTITKHGKELFTTI